MSQAATTPDDDISEQLKALVIEAAARPEAAPAKRSVPHSLPDPAPEASPKGPAVVEAPAWVREILNGIETLNSAYNENALRLNRIEKNVSLSDQLPQLLTDSRQALEQRNVVNRVMFEALHGELKGYKDTFMLEAVLRPIMRDLVSLYDDMVEIHRQIHASIGAQESRGGLNGGALLLMENVQTMGRNIEHNVHFILEVLERMEVTMIPENTGKLDKRTQRAVAVEVAESQEQDQNIVRIVKRGFQCRDRVIRPEEVIIQKWKDGSPAANPPSPNPQQTK